MSQLGSFFRHMRKKTSVPKKNPGKKSQDMPKKIFVVQEKEFCRYERVPENLPVPTFLGKHPYTGELFALFEPKAQIYVLYAGNEKGGMIRCQTSDIIRSADGMNTIHFRFHKRREILFTLPFKQQRDYLFASNRKGESDIATLISLNLKT
jgi:hypothetical protein